MEHKVKFIHTADLHLGSILHVKNRDIGKLKNLLDNSVYYAFKNICDAAIFNKVDFIVISGDIYDRESRSVKGSSFFAEQCRRLNENNIKVYAIAGNHDPIGKQGELFALPENVYIFSPENPEIKEFVDKEGNLACRLIGQSYKESSESRKMHKNYEVPRDGIFNIALLHTQLDNSSEYVPAVPSELKEKENIHYWALGHIHKSQTVSLGEPAIIFPGIPQGRDFGESGLNGAVLVEAEGTKIISKESLPIALVVFNTLDINLEDYASEQLNTINELEKIMIDRYEALIHNQDENSYVPLGYIIRWNITGRSSLYSLLEDKDEDISEYLADSLNSSFVNKKPFIYTDSLSLSIGKLIENLKEIIENNAAFMEIDKTIQEMQEDSILKAELIKELGSLWEVNDSLEDYNMKKLQLNDRLYGEILKKAGQLIFDELLGDGEEL